MSLRRIVAALAFLAVVVVAIVVVTGDDDKPEGETVRGLRGFPLRGSLADDTAAIDAAVAEWREEIVEGKEDDEDGDDAEERARAARRPDPDDDIAVLWVGRADDRDDVAILESRGLAAELERERGGKSWFLRGERLREEDFRGEFPIGVGESVVAPGGQTWRYVDAGFSSGYEEVGDGLFRDRGGLSADGFLLRDPPTGDLVPIHVTGVGGRVIRRDDYDAFAAALDDGFGRPVWLAAEQAADTLAEQDAVQAPDDPPPLAVVWTGRVPGYAHAATVLQGDSFGGTRSAALGYGETPGREDRSEDKDEGALSLGWARGDRRTREPNSFAAGTYTTLHDFPYLVLAGAGEVKTLHALVGPDGVRRTAPLAVIDARRFATEGGVDTVTFGRTADGEVVTPLQTR